MFGRSLKLSNPNPNRLGQVLRSPVKNRNFLGGDMLPVFLDVSGKKVKVNGDFRAILALDKIVGNDEIDVAAKKILQFYAPDGGMLSGIRKLFFSLRLRKNPMAYIKSMQEYISLGSSSDEEVKERAISFEQDRALIEAAFQHDYGIDLTTDLVEWRRFCALLQGLNESNSIIKIASIRTVKLDKIKDKEMRKYYAEMKRKFSLDEEEPMETDEQAAARAMKELSENTMKEAAHG